MNKPKLRHEIKHFINTSDYFTLRSRLKHIAAIDSFAVSDGTYQVRSLYFETPDNKALMEKINGINRREKFRLRLYNNDPSFIKLEKKSKVNGLCYKEKVLLSKEQCKKLLNDDIEWLLASDHHLQQELYAKIKHQLLQPKTVVDYTREAYVYAPGNVRITFDSHLQSGLYSREFLNPDLPTVAMVPDGKVILEVKYDEFLPELIRDIIQTNQRRSTAISKYAACRAFG
ncbi:MAG: polyphosphate polymerase domain-containing protein [Syntrophomonadaceae bacterium]|nr:polyphosphate polymerase domain-containing protein [Syntrophomonadaceae bacterium]MDD4550219.1 polyphosphate polymerase domain-containing protein [Syntrophomonadaceae bacterium]